MRFKQTLAAVVLATVGLTPAIASAATLFATTRGSGSTNSFLYSIDVTTGAGTLIGDIGYGVNGLTWDDTTSTLYGSTRGWSAGQLIAIDTGTGAGSAIGPLGTGSIWGMSANSVGDLYAWTENGDDLVSVNKTTGASTVVGNSGIGTGRGALFFDENDTLWNVNIGGRDFNTMNTSTGVATLVGSTGVIGDTHHGDVDDATGYFWTVNGAGSTPATELDIINLTTRTTLSTLTLSGISAGTGDLHTLAFADTTPIPLPAGVWMLLAGVGAVGATRRMKRA